MADSLEKELGIEEFNENELGIEEVSSPSEPTVGMGEAMTEGAKSGATFGFADELAGGLGGLSEYLSRATGGMDVPAEDIKSRLTPEAQARMEKAGIEAQPIKAEQKDLKELYKEYRDLARERDKQAIEQRPYSYGVGALAGGFAVPAGVMSAGLKAGAPLSKAMLQGAKVGALGGGVAGAGMSEAELTEPDTKQLTQFGKDVATGAGVGTVLGAATPAGLAALKHTAKGAKKLIDIAGEEVLGPTKEAFKRGLKGEMIVGEKARRELENEIKNFSEEMGSRFMEVGPRLAKLKGRLIERADKMGIKLDEKQVDDFLLRHMESKSKSNIPRSRRELEELQELMRTAKEGSLVKRVRKEAIPSKTTKVKEIEELKLAENRAIESGVDPNDIDTVFEDIAVPGKKAAVVRQKTYNKEGEFTGYKKLASRVIDEDDLGPGYKEITETVRSGDKELTKLGEMEQLRKDIATKSKMGEESFKTPDVQRAATKATEEARDMLREKIPALEKIDERLTAINRAAESLGFKDARSMTPQKILDKMTNIIRKQQKDSVPAEKARRIVEDFLEDLRIAAPKLAKDIEPQLQDLAAKVDVTEAAARPIYIPRPLATVEAYAVKGGNLAGYGIRQMTPDVMARAASKLYTKGGETATKLARTLERAATKNQRGRDAIIFSLMQNPEYRQLLRDVESRVFDAEETKDSSYTPAE